MGERQKETEKEKREEEDSETEQNEDISMLYFEIAVRIKSTAEDEMSMELLKAGGPVEYPWLY
jgi:hypothetical protein